MKVLCPICKSSNYKIIGTIWTFEECYSCSFEHSGSSGIVREHTIKKLKEKYEAVSGSL